METDIRKIPGIGDVLFMTDGKTELGVALDIGIRIVHLSHCGMENLYYLQDPDRSDNNVTEEGWCLYGGHRFWLSPESSKSYFPDNAKIEYTKKENGAVFVQKKDEWLNVVKRVETEFLPDGKIKITHSVTNIGEVDLSGAIWGVNTLDGGKGEVDFTGTPPGIFGPQRTVGVWRTTSLSDERLYFSEDKVAVRHIPGKEEFFKIGVYSRKGRIHCENKGQCLDISLENQPMDVLPDGGCNVEIFANGYMLEFETLFPRFTLKKGETASASEIWSITLNDKKHE